MRCSGPDAIQHQIRPLPGQPAHVERPIKGPEIVAAALVGDQHKIGIFGGDIAGIAGFAWRVDQNQELGELVAFSSTPAISRKKLIKRAKSRQTPGFPLFAPVRLPNLSRCAQDRVVDNMTAHVVW
jgi:hypothetical protein